MVAYGSENFKTLLPPPPIVMILFNQTFCKYRYSFWLSSQRTTGILAFWNFFFFLKIEIFINMTVWEWNFQKATLNVPRDSAHN